MEFFIIFLVYMVETTLTNIEDVRYANTIFSNFCCPRSIPKVVTIIVEIIVIIARYFVLFNNIRKRMLAVNIARNMLLMEAIMSTCKLTCDKLVSNTFIEKFRIKAVIIEIRIEIKNN